MNFLNKEVHIIKYDTVVIDKSKMHSYNIIYILSVME